MQLPEFFLPSSAVFESNGRIEGNIGIVARADDVMISILAIYCCKQDKITMITMRELVSILIDSGSGWSVTCDS